MRVTRRKFYAAAAAALVFGPVGCASMSGTPTTNKTSLLDRMPWASNKDPEPEPYPNPVKMAATWTPDTLVQSGRTPTRGFGGRIFFYDEKSRPVPVDGRLVVHGFDDQAKTNNGRVKRFEFTPEQFTRHFSQTDLGASYSVWIPWDAVGGDQQRISLVASFETAEGKTVQGIPATIMLPGQKAAGAETDEMANFSPQYREYLDAQESLTPRSSGLATTTIRRRRSPASSTPRANPGITIPSFEEAETMIAGNSNTPSLEIKTLRSPSRASVMPVSAQSPIIKR